VEVQNPLDKDILMAKVSRHPQHRGGFHTMIGGIVVEVPVYDQGQMSLHAGEAPQEPEAIMAVAIRIDAQALPRWRLSQNRTVTVVG
jgi:hypothetical protein